MAGNWYDWENEDSAEDEILVELIRLARKLGRLPTAEEIPEERKQYLMGSIPIYFGSFGGALEKVANLLYGNRLVTSLCELSSREENLTDAEKVEVLEKRQRYYQRFLEMLDRLGSLKAVRREQEEEVARKKRQKETEGYKVTKIPIMTRKEMKERHGERAFTDGARSTGGLFVKNGSSDDEKSTKKGSNARRRQWGYSGVSLGKEPRQTSQISSMKPNNQKSMPSPRQGVRANTQRRMPAKRERGGEANRVQAIETLWAVYQSCGRVPSSVQVDEYISEYEDESLVSAAVICHVLGNSSTWEAHLRNYAGARGLEFEPVTEPSCPELVQEEPEAGDPLKGAVEPEVCDTQNSQGGIDEMGRGPNVKKEEVFGILWDIYKTSHKMPSWGALNEYRETHPEVRVPNPRAFWKFLGEKDTWLEQVLAYAKDNGLIAELPPEQVNDNAGFADELEAPGLGGVEPSEAKDEMHQGEVLPEDGGTEATQIGALPEGDDADAGVVQAGSLPEGGDAGAEVVSVPGGEPMEADKAKVLEVDGEVEVPAPNNEAEVSAPAVALTLEKNGLDVVVATDLSEAVGNGVAEATEVGDGTTGAPATGSEGADVSEKTESKKAHVRRPSDEELATAIAAVRRTKKADEGASGDKDAEPQGEPAVKPASRKKKLKINIIGATLKYVVDGEECELEVEFGRP